MASAVGVMVHAWLSPQFDGKLGERLQLGELGSTAQEPEETVSCASAMLTIMTRKMIRASRGTDPTPQRRHGSGVTNAYAMFCSEGAQPHVVSSARTGSTVPGVFALTCSVLLLLL